MSSNGDIVPGEWIVSLRTYTTEAMDEEHSTVIRTKTEDSSTHFNCDVRCHFRLPELRGYVAKFDDETKAELEAMGSVAAIEPVQIYRHCTTSATATVQADAPWGLARISRREKVVRTGPFQYRYKATGEGTVAYVLDTGINDTHVEFEGRASKGPIFSSSDGVSDGDMDGHGTHVAGTIAGKTYGVAKKAEVVGVKVFNDEPQPGATNADILKAIEWVVDEAKSHGKPSVINLSLGGGPSNILDRAVASAVRAGVTCVVAAGNSRADLGSPSREPLAITVGATSIQDAPASSSNYGKIDILAPGVDITSAWIGKSNNEIKSISGTSMASPHVAGAVCCLLEMERLEPLLVMPQLLTWADKNKVSGLEPRTINALLQVSDD